MVRFVSDGGDEDDALAPVTPIFGESRQPAVAGDRVAAPAGPVWRTSWDDDAGDEDDELAEGEVGDCASIEREIAETNLLRKLRGRSLSVSEARAVVSERALDPAEVDEVIDAFLGRGYLDDRALADQLVHAGVDRKGQGRKAIAQTLAKRGIPRDIADAALAELPDDDAERALDYARSKARSLHSLDREVALRRLAGQLARRGYGGSVALTAARAALDEVAAPPGRVRFE